MLRDSFLPNLPAEVVAGDAEALEQALVRLVAVARAGHPEVAIDEAALVAHVASKIPGGRPVCDVLDSLDAAALHLTLAASRGDAAAIATIERVHGPTLRAALLREGVATGELDEIIQQMRVRLLATHDGRRPRIADYAGRSGLGRWLQAVAVRLAIDEHRTRKREIAVDDDELAELAISTPDPALASLKRRYATQVRASLREALCELDADQRRELRLYYLDGLTLEDLAGLARVAPSTIWRRLTRARETVLVATRRKLAGLDGPDVDSILDLVASRLELPHSALGDDVA